MGRLNLKTTVKVKQVISVKRTLQLSGVGFSMALMIVGLFFFAKDMSNSSDAKASTKNKIDSLYTAPNIDRGDSLVNNHSSLIGIKSEDKSHLLTDKDLIASMLNKKVNALGKLKEDSHDLIFISPKQTSGVFEVKFEIPSMELGTTKLEIVNRQGDVIERRTPQKISGLVNEVFTIDNSVPSGALIVKIHVGKTLYVRQVFYTKP